MRFGFHISIAGGFDKVLERAQERKCGTIQIFSRNPRGWEFVPINPASAALFRESMKKADIDPIVIHMPYLPNPASPEKDKLKMSVDSLTEEIRRAAMLGAKYVVVHAGKAMGAGSENACATLSDSINTALKAVKNEIVLLVENTAGQGTEIGRTIDELALVFSKVTDKSRVGICLDTAHAFGAGYDLGSKSGLDMFIKEFDSKIGLKKLKILHLNDSKVGKGSLVDRHENIGKGKIGMDGMKNILKCNVFRDLPMIMETPWTEDGPGDDLKNLQMALKLAKLAKNKRLKLDIPDPF